MRKTTKNNAVKVVSAQAVPIAEQISTQYRAVVTATVQMFREAIKFGAMLIQWEQFLGKSHAGANSGGEGLKGWLAENCPEIKYSTAIKYKLMAEENAHLLGGGTMALAALQGMETVQQPDGDVIDVDANVIERRNEIFDEAKNFQGLHQMYLDFMKEEDRPKAKKRRARQAAAAAEGGGLSMGDSATILWADAMRVFEENRSAFQSAARDLRKDVAGKFLEELKMLVGALEERVGKKK